MDVSLACRETGFYLDGYAGYAGTCGTESVA